MRLEYWNSGMMARPGATNVKTAASGEIDDQLFIRRTLYGFGLGQGIMGLKVMSKSHIEAEKSNFIPFCNKFPGSIRVYQQV